MSDYLCLAIKVVKMGHMPDIFQPELFFRSEYRPIQILAVAGL